MWQMLGAEVIEPVPWWVYLLGVIILSVVGYAIRLLVLGYKQIRLGQVLPRVTVDLMMAAKDKEIESLHREIDRNETQHIAELARKDRELERWYGLFQIADAARQELAGSVDSLTDVVQTNNALIQALPRRPEGGADAQRRR